MLDYVELSIVSVEEVHWEELIAQLEPLDFDSFWENEKELKAYIQTSKWNDDVQMKVNVLLQQKGLSFQANALPQVNWNAQWESNFEPVEIGEFCRLRASFHPSKTGFVHEICIDPKMSFGTGHHETTHMMIESMAAMEWNGLEVLDYGAGTGVLAILAAKMGAVVTGVEIEEIAVENARENAELNEVSQVHFILGELKDVPQRSYDMILANINRNVLTRTLPDLRKLIGEEGWLFLSGVLKEDEDIMVEAVHNAGFKIDRIKYRGEWTCFIVYPA